MWPTGLECNSENIHSTAGKGNGGTSFSDDGDEGESSAPNIQLDCRKPQWGFLRVFTAIRLAPKLALKYYSPLHLSVL